MILTWANCRDGAEKSAVCLGVPLLLLLANSHLAVGSQMPHVQSCTDLPEHAQLNFKAPGLISIVKPRLQLSQLIGVQTGQASVRAGELPQQEPSCASLQWLSVEVQHPDQLVAKKHRNRGRKSRESKTKEVNAEMHNRACCQSAESGDLVLEANASEDPLSTGYFERSETATSSTCSSVPTAQAGQDPDSHSPAPPGLERPIGWTLLPSTPNSQPRLVLILLSCGHVFATRFYRRQLRGPPGCSMIAR
ncbi:hypothetical protein AK812_SmicGene4397 [Symbiodinium microadriaticum]|uniref:Uncharacterized protein n=1 Tax=Symbiodinium microadriaticum TaxID=2951 RepID=A0A1Q9EWJ3_SYMMI|nr:hypothetical protein AK812_SmicGene4397 [Symbiodinium microadriaticum]